MFWNFLKIRGYFYHLYIKNTKKYSFRKIFLDQLSINIDHWYILYVYSLELKICKVGVCCMLQNFMFLVSVPLSLGSEARSSHTHMSMHMSWLIENMSIPLWGIASLSDHSKCCVMRVIWLIKLHAQYHSDIILLLEPTGCTVAHNNFYTCNP